MKPRLWNRNCIFLRVTLTAFLILPWCLSQATAQTQRLFTVCADPNNLPFSNDKLEGFENKIASLIAEELQATLHYTWSEQRRGFLRRTLLANRCDVVMGVPPGLPGVLITRPYYVSGYVFVSARDRNLQLDGFDAPVLRDLKIGLEAIGNDGANPPPVSAIARRGLASNVIGFSGADADSDGRAAKMVDAVANRQIDTAILWGPFGGYFAKRYAGRLAITLVTADPQQPTLPFSFPISLGVRKGDVDFQTGLQEVLDRRKVDIGAILEEYAVPIVPPSVVIAPVGVPVMR